LLPFRRTKFISRETTMKGRIASYTATALLTLASISASHADILGYTGEGGTPSGGQRGNFKRGSVFTMPTRGVLNSLCFYGDGSGGSTARAQHYRVVMYADANGIPGGKLAESSDSEWLNSSVAGSGAGSACETGLSHVPMEQGQKYWLVVHTSNPTGVMRYYSKPDTFNWYGNPDEYVSGADDPFGDGGGTGTGTVSVFAEYISEAVEATAGRRTIGANPSGGLRSDFKRGSPIDVTVPGEVWSFTAYLDGLGGNTGTQDITLALYGDANGVPGPLIQASTPTTIAAGTKPGWRSFSFPISHITLAPGRYWLMLHTGQNTGIVRYYADGTGNWYGNNDLYSDGPSNPFGSGGTGDGRISAFVSLRQPGN
jgi:hypothetical protein